MEWDDSCAPAADMSTPTGVTSLSSSYAAFTTTLARVWLRPALASTLSQFLVRSCVRAFVRWCVGEVAGRAVVAMSAWRRNYGTGGGGSRVHLSKRTAHNSDATTSQKATAASKITART